MKVKTIFSVLITAFLAPFVFADHAVLQSASAALSRAVVTQTVSKKAGVCKDLGVGAVCDIDESLCAATLTCYVPKELPTRTGTCQPFHPTCGDAKLAGRCAPGSVATPDGCPRGQNRCVPLDVATEPLNNARAAVGINPLKCTKCELVKTLYQYAQIFPGGLKIPVGPFKTRVACEQAVSADPYCQ